MRLSPLAQKWLMKHHGHRPQVKFFSKMPFNVQTLLKGRGTCVIDKIWQVWENRTIQFRKSDYPILEVSELNQ
jgi:hypothetical protein